MINFKLKLYKGKKHNEQNLQLLPPSCLKPRSVTRQSIYCRENQQTGMSVKRETCSASFLNSTQEISLQYLCEVYSDEADSVNTQDTVMLSLLYSHCKCSHTICSSTHCIVLFGTAALVGLFDKLSVVTGGFQLLNNYVINQMYCLSNGEYRTSVS